MKFETSCFTVFLLFGSSCLVELVQTGLQLGPEEEDLREMKKIFRYGSKCRHNGMRFWNFCVCPRYYTGEECQIKQCMNNGQLETSNLEEICKCPNPKYITGEHCEIVKCANHGVHDGQKCDCKRSYEGEFCEKFIMAPVVYQTVVFLVALIVALACSSFWFLRCRRNWSDNQQQLGSSGVTHDTPSRRVPSSNPRPAHRSSSSDDLISTERPTVFRPLTPDYANGYTQHLARVGLTPFSGHVEVISSENLPPGPPPSYHHAVSEQANPPSYTQATRHEK